MAFAQLPFYLAAPAALLCLWLPRLGRPTPIPAAVGPDPFARLTRDLSHTTSHNALSAAGVAFSVRQLAARVQSQLGAAAQIVSSAEVMIGTEQATSQLSQQALGAASEAHRHGVAGREVLAESIHRMHQLSERATASRELIEALSQRSEDIQRVTAVIQSIASQTNLLALNAAIEAARAGEYGRGFAVVADEVRGLAGRTASATEEVGQMVADIQLRTAQVVEQIRQLAADLGEGVVQVEHTGEQLETIAALAAGVETQVGEIARGAETNREQLASLFQAVEQMREDLAVSDGQTRSLAEGCRWRLRRSASVSVWPKSAWTIITSVSMTWLVRGRGRSPRNSSAMWSRGASAWTICSIARTSQSPIRSRANSTPVSIATPIRCCPLSRSRCSAGMRAWCSRLPARHKAMCPLTTRLSASR